METSPGEPASTTQVGTWFEDWNQCPVDSAAMRGLTGGDFCVSKT